MAFYVCFFFVVLLLPIWLVIPVTGKNFFSNVFFMTGGLKQQIIYCIYLIVNLRSI